MDEGIEPRSARDEQTYLIVVPALELALYEYLRRRYAGDHKVEVLLDRRAVPRPGPRNGARGLYEGITVARRGRRGCEGSSEAKTQHGEEEQRMEGAEVLEDRQRVDRWLEESQYMLGRMVPGYLDDRDRLKHKLASAEQDSDRLRLEIDELRREIASLHNELNFYRGEQTAAAEALAAALGHLSDLQKPLAEVNRRLQANHPTLSHA